MKRDFDSDSEVRNRVRELQKGLAVEPNTRWLFHRFYPRVLGFLQNRGFSGDGEDMAQDVFFQAFRHIESFRGQSSFESWLFAIAANICRNELRRRGRDKRLGYEVSLDTHEDSRAPVLDVAAPQATPERRAFEKERISALNQEIQRLPVKMRQCFTLRHDRGLKYREIAILLNVSVETVKAHLFQARQRLKNRLGQDFED